MKFSIVKDKYRHEIRKITGTVQGGTGIFRWTRTAPRVAIMAMNITVPSSEAERRLPAAGMSLSLLTEYKGNGQSNQLLIFLCQIRKRSIIGNRSWILPIIDSS